jgi:murein hydrolase activator
VLDGVVDDVMDIGGGVAVLIKRDRYFFIYSDLSATVVTKGQQVTAGTILGVVGDEGQLDFRLYDANDVWLDPEKWLEASGSLKK